MNSLPGSVAAQRGFRRPGEHRPHTRRGSHRQAPAPEGGTTAMERRPFFVEVIKPSHYDDDGYVIQWMRAFIPSNSLACLYALVQDVGERRLLGEDVEVVANV